MVPARFCSFAPPCLFKTASACISKQIYVLWLSRGPRLLLGLIERTVVSVLPLQRCWGCWYEPMRGPDMCPCPADVAQNGSIRFGSCLETYMWAHNPFCPPVCGRADRLQDIIALITPRAQLVELRYWCLPCASLIIGLPYM